MVRRKSRRKRDTWLPQERGDGLWVARELAPGWTVEHRVTRQGSIPVIVETRVRAVDDTSIPVGGIDSALLRRLTVRGVGDAAAPRLQAADASLAHLRTLERSDGATRRRGEARRWNLMMTASAYWFFVHQGSRRPNEATAELLGIPVRTVRDRLHAARRSSPPLLTGGGGRGVIGRPAFTDAGHAVIKERTERVMASLGAGQTIMERWQHFPSGAAFDRTFTALLHDAERRIPGLWELSIEEVAERAETAPPPLSALPAGKRLVATEAGLDVVDEPDPG